MKNFKRLMSLSLIFVILFSTIIKVPVFAEDLNSEGWTYIINESEITITGYTGGDSNITIPATIDGKPVTAISDGAFAGSPIIINVVVSSGVTTIGEEVFADCPNLESVVLPESVTSIGRRAFRYSQKLESVTLPTSLLEFPYQCFWDCQSLEEIVIPQGVSVIPNGSFYNCYSLISVTVPDSVTTIEKNAFHACLKLEDIELSNNVINIDLTAFSDCEYLVIDAQEGSVADVFAKAYGYVPENVVLESEHPYYDYGYWEYTYPTDAVALKVTFSPKTFVSGFWDMDDITIIDADENEYVFAKNELSGQTLVLAGNYFSLELSGWPTGEDFGFRITDIEPMDESEYQDYIDELNANPWQSRIVNGTLEITGYRGTLGSVTLPNKINGIHVVSIADYAFRNNRFLTDFTIESGIIRIGESAFESCENLETISIPETVEEIGDYAFYDCNCLKEIVFPNNLTSLPEGILAHCWDLESVTLPSELEEIGESAFNQCQSLTEITIPETVEEIGEYAFCKSGLTGLTIPDGVTVIRASLCSGCYDLETVDLPDDITEFERNAFMDCVSLLEIELPSSLTTINYGCFSNSGLTKIELPDGITTIGGNAFSATDLTSIYIPASVSGLGDAIAYNCDKMVEFVVDQNNPYYKSVDNMIFNKAGDTLSQCAPGLAGEIIIPEGTETINIAACSTMINATSFKLPSTIKQIGNSAFNSCTTLESIEIPEGVTEISYSTFGRCSSLKEVILPESITLIDRTAFGYCSSLKNIVLPSNLKCISQGAFMYSGLESIVIPEGIETIDDYALGFCSNLKFVTLPDSIPNLNEDALYQSNNAIVITTANSDSFNWAKENLILAVDLPKANINLKENGNELALIKAGISSKGNIYYALKTDESVMPTKDDYSSILPTATKAGKYYVWYKVVVEDEVEMESMLAVKVSPISIPNNSEDVNKPTESTSSKTNVDALAANNVITMINEIGNVSYSNESKLKILDARAAYDALTAAQKALVNNIDTLIQSETKYQELVKTGYTITSVAGLNNNEWSKDSQEGVTITVKFNGDDDTSFEHFIDVKLDDKKLEKEKDYDAKKGSTIITLKKELLENLADGEHIIKIVYDNGEVETKLNILSANNTSPTPAENNHLGLWIISIIVILIIAVSTFFIFRNKKVNK